jgi:hypothetical protein
LAGSGGFWLPAREQWRLRLIKDVRRELWIMAEPNGGRLAMTRKAVLASMLMVGILLASAGAQAHCDSADGPVAKAVRQALEDGNIHPVLVYAPASAEVELQAAFERSRSVRGLGGDARALADQAFMETAVRLHRAGEGAPYTGLKPAGLDYGPVVPAADHALETGDLSKLKTVLFEEIEHALAERFAHVRELQDAPLQPQSSADVPAARARVSAELGFVTFVESLRQVAHGKGTDRHAD